MRKSYVGILGALTAAIGLAYMALSANRLDNIESELDNALAEVDDLKDLLKNEHLKLLAKDPSLLAANLIWLDRRDDTNLIYELTGTNKNTSGHRYFTKNDFRELLKALKKDHKKKSRALAMVEDAIKNDNSIAIVEVDTDNCFYREFYHQWQWTKE